MEFLAFMIAIVIFIVLLQSGELPLVLFAVLLALNIVDDKTLAAMARQAGKVYYMFKVKMAEILGIERELLNAQLNIREVLEKSLEKSAGWRSKRVQKKLEERKKEELIAKLYQQYVGGQRG